MNAIIIIILAVLGASLGSFFNVLIDRLPRKQSIILPRSRCSSCQKTIPFYYNIPIFSYIILHGKCRYCSSSIHWHHLLVEIVTPILFIGLHLVYGIDNFLFYKYALLFCLLIPIFFIDALHHIIPHLLSIPIIVAGLIFALFRNRTDIFFLNAAFTSVTVFCFLFLIAWFYLKVRKTEGLGGGDIWLLTGLGAYFGFINIPFILLLAALMGIVYFVIFIRSKDMVFAFGNFIALAAIIWTLFGNTILDKYL
ncbi:MAG: prepilin peptidase [Candidatus Cloacimonadaceae bacterium]|nr:prepilin peptidase [Candidatus Cloacimonadaceae bacterium]